MADQPKNMKPGAAPAARPAAASSAPISEALLLTTFSMIGMPVDVQARDGSVYSGIFYTASVEEEYAVVLKIARMIKKGNLVGNVVDGTVIDTLVIGSEDLVQVVAKGVILPTIRGTGYMSGNGTEAYNGCLERDSDGEEHIESEGIKMPEISRAKSENGIPYSSAAEEANIWDVFSADHDERLTMMESVQIEATHNIFVDERQEEDGLNVIKSDYENYPELQDKMLIDDVQSSLSSTGSDNQSTAVQDIVEDAIQQEPKGVSSSFCNGLEDKSHERPNSDEAAAVYSTPNVSIASAPINNVKSGSRLSASSNPFLLVPPSRSSTKKTSKESKLNPGAKIFSPSMTYHWTETPLPVPIGANVSYMPGTTYAVAPIAPQDEVDASSFVRYSVPVKFVPYNNPGFADGVSDGPFVVPIIGPLGSRTQPVRYTSQYQNFQSGPAYVHQNHQNHQNVMYRRVGPLVCVHPISDDVTQSAAGFSSAAQRPVLTPHQVHLPKHQGSASAQALQLCMAPPIIASGQQPYGMPFSMPISQPLFPVQRPIGILGSNGFLSIKSA